LDVIKQGTSRLTANRGKGILANCPHQGCAGGFADPGGLASGPLTQEGFGVFAQDPQHERTGSGRGASDLAQSRKGAPDRERLLEVSSLVQPCGDGLGLTQ
jgi:hypothetical protein